MNENLSLNFSFVHFYMKHGSSQFNLKQSKQESGIYPFDATAIKPLISASDQPISSASNDETISLATLSASLNVVNDLTILSTSGKDQLASSYTMVSGKDCSYCSDTSFEESIFLLPRTKLHCLKEGTTMGIICTIIRYMLHDSNKSILSAFLMI